MGDIMKIKALSGMARKLPPKYPDTFIGEDYGEYHFNRNEKGVITGFVVQHITFEKFQSPNN